MACGQAFILISAAERAFFRSHENFRRVKERFVGVRVLIALLHVPYIPAGEERLVPKC